MAAFRDMEMGWSGSGWMDPMPSSTPIEWSQLLGGLATAFDAV